MQFVRRYSVRVVIGAVLLAMAWGATSIYMPYADEQRLARKLKDFDVKLNYRYHGPEWVPQSIRPRLHFLQRVDSCDLRGSEPLELMPVKYLAPPPLTETDDYKIGSSRTREVPRELDAAAISKTPVEWRAIGDSELAEISEFKHVTMLSLNVRRISDSGLAHLGKMSCVWFIWLGEDDFNSLDQSPQRFADLPKITAAGLRHLSGMQRLQSLTFYGVHITDESLSGLAGMTQLRHLSLYSTAVKGPGIVHLSGLTSLSELYLPGIRVTDEGLVTLKGSPSLNKLTIDMIDASLEDRDMFRKAMPNCTVKQDP